MFVNHHKNSKPSAELLENELNNAGYNGLNINWGTYSGLDGLNSSEAVKNASNKRLALELMTENDVPTPKLYLPPFDDIVFPVVGRRDKHTRGSGFFLCYDQYDFDRTRDFNRPPTHYLQFIGNTREFRVHIFNGKSIKISEKIGTGIIRNYSRDDNDIVFKYPKEFKRKQLLRDTAIQAIDAIGLDFGAVDILYKNGQVWVLEVNTSPQLTDSPSTLSAYVRAFMSLSQENAMSQNNFLTKLQMYYSKF